MIEIAHAAEQAIEIVANAGAESAQNGLLGSLGINLKLFIAQLINFAIVLFVLWKFAWKPLLAIMNERQNKIEEGIDNAKKAESDLQMAELNYNKRIKEAEFEYSKVLNDAESKAEKMIENAKEKARIEIEKLTTKARLALKEEKAELEKEIKEKTVEIAFSVAEKILGEKLDVKKEKKFIDSIL